MNNFSRFVSFALPVAAFFTGCSTLPPRYHLLISEIRTASHERLSTSDPAEKNRLLRENGTVFLGIRKGFKLLYEDTPGMLKKTLDGLTVYSRDEGIVLRRPDIHDCAPCVVVQPANLQLFWSGGGKGGDHIFHARSSNGYLWRDTHALIAPSKPVPPVPADSFHNTDPSMVHLNGRYYLYYTGTKNGTIDNEIFLATSSNGKRWTKYSKNNTPAYPTPVIANTTPDGTYGIGKPSALCKGNTMYLYYTDMRRGKGGLWRAQSSDGIAFTNLQQIAPEIENADVKYCPRLDLFFMVYGEMNDERIYFSISKDGVNWPPHDPERTIAAGLPETIHFAPCIAADPRGHIEPETRVFYSGGIYKSASTWLSTLDIESTWVKLEKQ